MDSHCLHGTISRVTWFGGECTLDISDTSDGYSCDIRSR